MSKPTRKRARRDPGPPRLPLWRVSLAEHDVDRWHIEGRTVQLGAASEEIACHAVVRLAHVRAEVPPLRRFVALSMEHTHADSMRSPATRSEAA